MQNTLGSCHGRITFVRNAAGDQIIVRSRLEARWVTFFDALGLTWEYEPQQFCLRDGRRYTPDFYVDEVGWIEIKATPHEARAAEEKLAAFALQKGDLIGDSRRKDFYSIVGTRPELDIHCFHRWDPHPAEIFWAADIYELFCGKEVRRREATSGLHRYEWLKMCLAKAQASIDPLRSIGESVLEVLRDYCGVPFRGLSGYCP